MLVGLVSLLMMPVDYRGGAAISHPHVIAQLIADVTNGSLDHHGGDVASFGHVHGQQPHRFSAQHPPEGPVPLIPDSEVSRHVTSPFSAAAIAATAKLTIPAPASVRSDDEPALSPRTAAGTYVLYPLLLPAAVLLVWRWSAFSLHWRLSLAWQGVSPALEPPPPRAVALPT